MWKYDKFTFYTAYSTGTRLLDHETYTGEVEPPPAVIAVDPGFLSCFIVILVNALASLAHILFLHTLAKGFNSHRRYRY